MNREGNYGENSGSDTGPGAGESLLHLWRGDEEHNRFSEREVEEHLALYRVRERGAISATVSREGGAQILIVDTIDAE